MPGDGFCRSENFPTDIFRDPLMGLGSRMHIEGDAVPGIVARLHFGSEVFHEMPPQTRLQQCGAHPIGERILR